MRKEALMALVLGIVMITSLVGFAGISVMNTPSDDNQNDIELIVDRALTAQEKIQILRAGRVIIEFFYDSDNCTDCLSKVTDLEMFANQYLGYIILSKWDTNETESLLQMIGKEGMIQEFDDTSQENLLDLFCDLALVQPRECLLREF